MALDLSLEVDGRRSFVEYLEGIDEFLRTYSGRDKLLRLWQYSAVFCDGLGLSKLNSSWLINWCSHSCRGSCSFTNATESGVAKSIGGARLVFRLLNIPSSLCHVKNTLELQQDKNGISLALDIIECLTNMTYNPVEQSVWAGQVGLLKVNVAKFSLWCTKLWLVLLLVNIIKSLQSISNLNKSTRQRKIMHLLNLIQNCSDLINAVHFLPSGFLWSSRLSPIVVGIMGMISSTIALYKLLL